MDLKLVNNSQLALTDGYIPVEYIESSGYPNINTGVSYSYSSRNLKIDAIIDVIDNSTAGSIIYDATNGVRETYLKCADTGHTSFTTKYYSQNNQAAVNVEFSGKTHIIEYLGHLEINDTEYTLPSTSVAVSATLYLLKSGSAKVRTYSFKVYQSTTLLRDYIPVISYQEGHFGEACLYDKVNGVFYYSASTGSFTASTNIYNRITTAFVKDCPNISGIDLLRRAVNLQRIRCNISDVSGSIEELKHYATLSGYSDNYEEQIKPRIVGNFTINTYHTNEEKNSIDIDGLVLFSDNNYNVDYLLDNNLIAVQTVDENEEGYNQPVAEVLLSNNLAHSLASDSTKILMTKAEAASITSLPVTLFKNTEIENFDEFKYWTGLTTITAGSSTSATGAFGGCTALESITIPNTITTIGAYAFYNCSALKDITIPSTVTTIGTGSFYNTTALKNIEFPIGISLGIFKINSSNNSMGCYQGNMIVHGNVTSNSYVSGYAGLLFNNVIIHGSITLSGNSGNLKKIGGTANFYIKDTLHLVTNYTTSSMFTGARNFLSVGGDITVAGANSRLTVSAITNVHLEYNSVITATPTQMNINSLTNVYVGDGSSRSNDEAVLALYLADTNWSAYSAKLGTWYDYNGTYKWYYITDNLTNCTNTNPDEWPHITRGESYETTIVPDEGMTISSVTIEMLDIDTTSPTYDTMVDITSSVYNSATGEINIPSVTGNVVITASAS